MRIVHNIQEAKTVEDMGGNMPRIYNCYDRKFRSTVSKNKRNITAG
jgi:hypothetical protein